MIRWNKRCVDIIISVGILACSIPLCILLAILIKMTSRGPFLYCSVRVGQEGRLFKCWKFRSMYVDAEMRLQQLLASNSDYRREWEAYFKLKNDPRLTWIGKFLRRTSLDELPQLWNVLRGDLSLVGPRPFLPQELSVVRSVLEKEPLAKMKPFLLDVRPGLTGLWQISGRNHLTFEKRIQLDLEYIHSWSFMGDIVIMLKTIPVLLFGKGAF